MKLLALDAMGVIYRARDDVAELLIPFIRNRIAVSDGRVLELYLQCCKGDFSSAVFWRRIGLSPAVEDDYLGGHSLVHGVKEFVTQARTYFDAVWCLSNDISEWSKKLRKKFALENLFDGFIISGDVKSMKPSPEIYQALLAAAHANPGDVVFIDDRRKNVRAALDLGMDSFLFGKHATSVEGFRCAENYAELKALLFKKTDIH